MVPPVAVPVTKKPCPTGMNLLAVLLLVPNPLIPAGATGAVGSRAGQQVAHRRKTPVVPEGTPAAGIEHQSWHGRIARRRELTSDGCRVH